MNKAAQREEAVFNAALDLPAPFRADYLMTACGEDRQLLAQVHALFQALGEPVAGPDQTATGKQRKKDKTTKADRNSPFFP